MEKKYFLNFNDAETIDIPAPPMKRQIFFGDHMLVGKNVILAHTLVPAHSHPEEQISVVVKGECDVITYLEGETLRQHCVPGGIAWFPSGVKHELLCTSDEDCEVWDWFSPVREDWIPKD